MEESALAIIAEVQRRLSKLLIERDFSPPSQLQGVHPKAILLGKASLEQQAIATLYGQMAVEHERMHEAENLPMGIHPRVNFTHYRNHVAMPLLSELLIWSAHRDYPDISETISIQAIRLDTEWNLYAVPRI